MCCDLSTDNCFHLWKLTFVLRYNHNSLDVQQATWKHKFKVKKNNSVANSIYKEKHICSTLSLNRDLNCLSSLWSSVWDQSLGFLIGNNKRKAAVWEWLPSLETEGKVSASQIRRGQNKKTMYEVFQFYVKRSVLWLLVSHANNEQSCRRQ